MSQLNYVPYVITCQRALRVYVRKARCHLSKLARKARWHASTFLARRVRNLADSFIWFISFTTLFISTARLN